MFEGFAVEDLAVGDAVIHVRHAGRGRAVLLLHGHPRTGATWHRIAPALVELGFRVVVPDLRGQGASRGPAPAADHAPASKRAMGRDLVAVMDALGIGRFSIAGHDRGSYVAYRMAMDHPRRLNRLALLDCLPIVEHLERTDEAFATAWWHWFFYAQPDIPERVINADPEAWYHGDPERMGRKIEVPLLPLVPARRPRTAARRSGGDLARMGRGRERPWASIPGTIWPRTRRRRSPRSSPGSSRTPRNDDVGRRPRTLTASAYSCCSTHNSVQGSSAIGTWRSRPCRS